jgi:hypothetical protein
MRIPVITGEDAYFAGRIDLLHLNCEPNSESFGVRYLFRISVIHEQLCVLHRGLDVVRMVLRVGHVCRTAKQRMRTEIWYAKLLNLPALKTMKNWEVSITEVLGT